jgi:hypothetical protein
MNQFFDALAVLGNVCNTLPLFISSSGAAS